MSKKNENDAAPAETAPPKTCFVIMPISDVDGYPNGHFAEVYSQLIEPAVKAAGYSCSLATSTTAANMIQLDVVTKIATADLCICDLSTKNANVLFEYDIRQAFDKPTVLIKDDITDRIFDLHGFRDIEYDHSLRIANTLEARLSITSAIVDTVEGNKDSAQVFSLVRLMKMTKAALPEAEISRDDARFSLLENKLNGIVALLSGRENSSAQSVTQYTLTPHRPFGSLELEAAVNEIFGRYRYPYSFHRTDGFDAVLAKFDVTVPRNISAEVSKLLISHPVIRGVEAMQVPARNTF